MRVKTILMTAFIAVATLVGCASKSNKGADEDAHKILVCYFSATGTTERAAQRIAELTGGTLHEITPEVRYTDADLDWRDSLSRSSVEMRNRSFRPEIADSVPDMEEYSIVFIGYPNWWNTHPTVVNTFIEDNNLEGKLIVPFMTSGGSNIINSENELKESYPGLTFAKGLLMNNVTDEEITEWIESLTKE